MKNNCVVKNCKGKYGGRIDVAWRQEKNEKLQFGRLPFCDKHFKQIYPALKRIEKKQCKKNQFWAFAPMIEIEKILNAEK